MQYAVSIARNSDADVHAVQVRPHDRGLWLASDTRAGRLRRAPRPVITQGGASVGTATLYGAPERVIPAYAQLNAASLIVVPRDYGSYRFWRHSAIASRVGRSSPVPALIVPPRPDVELQWSPRTIVAAADFTVASAIALRTAADLSNGHGAHVKIVHAMEQLDQMVFTGAEAWLLMQRTSTDATEIGIRLRRKAMTCGLSDAEPVVVTGDPHRGILNVATETSADLIVMGVAPRTWIDETVWGSTLRAVVRRATTPVLVVPVIAGAHEWIDEVDEHAVSVPSTPARSAWSKA
jgi:nucleotide-binding universal stress UspA family protein